MPSISGSPRFLFKEVIRPPLWLISFMYFMLMSLVLAIWAAFDNAAALNAFGIAIVLGLVAIYLSISTITVDQEEIRIGRAHIPLRYLSEVEILSKREFALTRTRNADPAAYLATTFWLSQGVKVAVNDQRDPTPYWLISTRKSQELKRVLEGEIKS